MVSEELVRAAYQLILGREPENNEVIRSTAGSHQNVRELRRSFLASAEFRDHVLPALHSASAATPSLDLRGPQQVEVECDAERLGRLLEHVERTWTKLGEQKPYWSVLTGPEFENDQFESNRDAFYETGRHDSERFQIWANRNGISLSRAGSCLEFGCGVGRVTRWLARLFAVVVGCDISAPHLRLARQTLDEFGPFPNVRLLDICTLAALEEFPAVDVVFSIIVLQHNPPPIIALILKKLLACLRPSGIAFFQVPTSARNYRFSVDEYLKTRGDQAVIEMHVIPQKDVFTIVRQAGCDVVEVQPDDLTGSRGFISNTFLVQKPR